MLPPLEIAALVSPPFAVPLDAELQLEVYEVAHRVSLDLCQDYADGEKWDCTRVTDKEATPKLFWQPRTIKLKASGKRRNQV